ncbi:hypothetical protein L6R52_30710 [Myxococcota bacterium]|nr:hypothetical protein [Myxococcota bacterium]
MATKKTKTKRSTKTTATAKRAKPTRKPAKKPVTNGADEIIVGAPPLDQDCFDVLRVKIERVPKEDASMPKYPVDDGATVAIRTAEQAEQFRRRLIGLEASAPGITEALNDLPRLGRALRHLNDQLGRAQAAEGWALVPEALVIEGDALRGKMADVLRYNLKHVPKVTDELDDLRQGVGHRDRVKDLNREAALYDEYAEVLAKDGVHYDPADAGRARENATKTLDCLDREKGGESAKWSELRSKTNTLLLEAHDYVTRALWLLDKNAPLERYAGFYAAVRALRGNRSSKRPTEAAPDAPAEVVAPPRGPNGSDETPPSP